MKDRTTLMGCRRRLELHICRMEFQLHIASPQTQARKFPPVSLKPLYCGGGKNGHPRFELIVANKHSLEHLGREGAETWILICRNQTTSQIFWSASTATPRSSNRCLASCERCRGERGCQHRSRSVYTIGVKIGPDIFYASLYDCFYAAVGSAGVIQHAKGMATIPAPLRGWVVKPAP